MNDALRLVDWLTAGGGGGIVGGVDWVFTSAGESGIVPTFCTLLPAMRERERKRKVQRGEKADGHWDAAPERIAGVEVFVRGWGGEKTDFQSARRLLKDGEH